MDRIRPALALVVIGVVGVLGGCGSTTPSATPSLTPRAAEATPPPYSQSSPQPSIAGLPDCRISQLRFSYLAGGVGAGNNFGTINVVNDSAQACAWRGRLSVVPLNRRMTVIATHARTAVDSPGILMTAHGYVSRSSTPPAHDAYGWIGLGGGARDDPLTGLGCTPAHEVTPAYWRVTTAGGVAVVANFDSVSSDVVRNGYAGVTACRADFNNLFPPASNIG